MIVYIAQIAEHLIAGILKYDKRCRLITLFFCLVVIWVIISGGRLNAQEQRIALVIGNADYKSSPLTNPLNDALDLGTTLQSVGFDVKILTNVGEYSMEQAIRAFGDRIKRSRDTVGLFYFAGHGMQIDGRNYLIPVGSNIQEADEVPYKAVDAGFVLSKMQSAENRLNIIILDACRDNPFKTSFRSSSRGLSMVEAPTGSIVIYSTAPGKVAMDGDGSNGVFTKALLEHVSEPGINIETMLKRVRNDVLQATGGRQIPWSSSSLYEDFYFIPSTITNAAEERDLSSIEVNKTSSPLLPAETSSIVYGLPEKIPANIKGYGVNEEIEGTGRITDIPTGTYTVTIRWSRDYIEKQDINVVSQEAYKLYRIEKAMVPVDDGGFFMSKYEITNKQIVDILNWALMEGKVTVDKNYVRTVGSNSKLIVNIGSRDCQIEYRHGQFIAFENKSDFPCIHITWYGSAVCCNYLSIMEGYSPVYDENEWRCDWTAIGYRLPKTSEWKLAAEGGRQNNEKPYAGSNDLNEVGWFRGNSGFETHEKGEKLPNGLEIYDMSGNVREWCWDCPASSKDGNPSLCSERELCGGGIYDDAQDCTIDHTAALQSSHSKSDVGFRFILPF